MTSPTHSRPERLAFSGEDEDFPAFNEPFEARMHVLKLGDCLENKLEMPAVKTQETAVTQLPKIKPQKRSGGRGS